MKIDNELLDEAIKKEQEFRRVYMYGEESESEAGEREEG